MGGLLETRIKKSYKRSQVLQCADVGNLTTSTLSMIQC